MLFWDEFKANGSLGAEPETGLPISSLCLERTVEAGKDAEFTFVLAWHFPNRTPDRCGWTAPKGEGKTVIGNWYTTRFRDAWNAARYLAENLPRLES